MRVLINLLVTFQYAMVVASSNEVAIIAIGEKVSKEIQVKTKIQPAKYQKIIS